jgi:DNA polymerase III subunit delta
VRPKPHFSRVGAMEQQLRLWTDAALGQAADRLLQAVSDTRRRPALSETVLRRTTMALCMMAAQH